MITPKNWETFQHYKDRAPSWIKLHRGLLDDYAFACLPVASQALAPLLWLLASEYEGGKITATEDEIAFRLRRSTHDIFDALMPLIKAGFFIKTNDVAECKQVASVPLADCDQDAIPEREGEIEEEGEGERKKDAPIRSAPAPMNDETEVYRRGKEILGQNAGGLIKNLVKAKNGSIPHARAAIEIASTKHDPREYIGAIIKGTDPPDDARARGDAW